MTINLTYKSNDFYSTAVCIASGAKLVDIEKTTHNFVNFILNISNSEAKQIISRHWSRELRIPTRDVIEAINELKTRIHNSY